MQAFRPSAKLGPVLPDPTKPYIHRDVSWLQFNHRVLAEAADKKNPLFERLKFISISASNLDEFFMIRMASVLKTIVAAVPNKRLQEIGNHILSGVEKFHQKQRAVLLKLGDDLKTANIRIVTDIYENRGVHDLAEKIFSEKILPELAAPQNLIWNLLTQVDSLQSFILIYPLIGKKLIIGVPKKLRGVYVEKMPEDGARYIFFLDQLLEAFVGRALSITGSCGVFRLTRDGDVSVELHDEQSADSMPEAVRSSLGYREHGRPIRLQYRGAVPPVLILAAQKALRLKNEQVFHEPLTFCLNGLWGATQPLAQQITAELAAVDGKSPRAPLSYEPLEPVVPKTFFMKDGSVFEHVARSDYLFHHPYDSFEAYVHWIEQACADESVSEICQTIYRVDAQSPVIAALKTAAAKKKIRVVIELRARFDELNNLKLADELRHAGAQVVFGFGKLKAHSKLSLVTRREAGLDGAPRDVYYTHLSTGNYHAGTAKLYTDLAIVTADQTIGLDAKYFFDSVARGQVPNDFKVLVSAPQKLHKKLLQLIDSEVAACQQGLPARIFAKVNALVDEAIIEELYRASNAGVPIDLMVRGACSLVPGVPGLSENIRVFSIVDRFLEHSRIYFFEGSRSLYLSSADWMPRNFFSRLELAFPVLSPKIFSYIKEVVIPTYLADNVKSHYLSADGIWRKRPHKPDASLRAQFRFEELAHNWYRGTNLERKNPDSDSARAPG